MSTAPRDRRDHDDLFWRDGPPTGTTALLVNSSVVIIACALAFGIIVILHSILHLM